MMVLERGVKPTATCILDGFFVPLQFSMTNLSHSVTTSADSLAVVRHSLSIVPDFLMI